MMSPQHACTQCQAPITDSFTAVAEPGYSHEPYCRDCGDALWLTLHGASPAILGLQCSNCGARHPKRRTWTLALSTSHYCPSCAIHKVEQREQREAA